MHPGTDTVLDPRVERTRQVVLDATIQLLAEEGYGAVTIEAVAARSRVAKSTIYRHWPGRVELINDAFQAAKPPAPPPGDGPIREQVVTRLEHLAECLATSTWSSCLPSLIDAAERDPEAWALHRQLSENGRQALVQLLAEGVRRGELPDDLEPDVVADALAGPLFMHRLLYREPLAPTRVRDLVNQILPAAASGRRQGT